MHVPDEAIIGYRVIGRHLVHGATRTVKIDKGISLLRRQITTLLSTNADEGVQQL
jgi:hypothetical protein